MAVPNTVLKVVKSKIGQAKRLKVEIRNKRNTFNFAKHDAFSTKKCKKNLRFWTNQDWECSSNAVVDAGKDRVTSELIGVLHKCRTLLLTAIHFHLLTTY